MHYEKSTSWQRQYDALANVLLGNLGSCASCFDWYNLTKHCCWPVTPLCDGGIPRWQWYFQMAVVFPDGSGFFQRDNAPCYTANIVLEFGFVKYIVGHLWGATETRLKTGKKTTSMHGSFTSIWNHQIHGFKYFTQANDGRPILRNNFILLNQLLSMNCSNIIYSESIVLIQI